MAKQKEESEVLGTDDLVMKTPEASTEIVAPEVTEEEETEGYFNEKKVYKVTITKDYNGLKKGEVQEVSGNVANALLSKGLISKK